VAAAATNGFFWGCGVCPQNLSIMVIKQGNNLKLAQNQSH
jgi:uncharacterized protein YcsI (UPF0317 family)